MDHPCFFFAKDASILRCVDSCGFIGFSDCTGSVDQDLEQKLLTERLQNALALSDREQLLLFCRTPISDDPMENVLLLSLRQFYFFRVLYLEKTVADTDIQICGTLFFNTDSLYESSSPLAKHILPELQGIFSHIPTYMQTHNNDIWNDIAPLTLMEDDGLAFRNIPCRVVLPVLLQWYEKVLLDTPMYRDVVCSFFLPPPNMHGEYTLSLAVRPFVHTLFSLHRYLYQIAQSNIIRCTLIRTENELAIRWLFSTELLPENLRVCNSVFPLLRCTPQYRSLLLYLQYLLHTHRWHFILEHTVAGFLFTLTLDCDSEDWETLEFKFSNPVQYAENCLSEVFSTISAITTVRCERQATGQAEAECPVLRCRPE